MLKNMTEAKNRLYTLEWFRIFFIILGHIMGKYPDIKASVMSLLHTKETHTWFGVEFFFIMGGFFLYKRLQSTTNIGELIKKIYIRLLPALLFVFIICCTSKTVSFSRFPAILSLCTGLTIPGEVIGWGDWYVGTYFWCSLLFIGLFSNNLKRGFLWTAVLAYLTLCLKFNAPNEGWMKTYYTIIGNQFIRGVYSMGLGMVAGYLSEHSKFPDKLSSRLIFTVIEACFMWWVLSYIFSSSKFNFWETELIFAALLVLIDHSVGYVSYILNRYEKVQYLSRYTYSIFLGHIPFIRYLSLKNVDLAPVSGAILVGGGASC